MDLDKVDPVEFAAQLSRLPPTHEMVAAARAAVDVADGRHAMAEASRDVAGGYRSDGGATDARRMWEGRAEVDGPGSRAAAKADELARPPQPDTAAGVTTRQMVDEAKAWAAERCAAEAEADRAADEACARHAADAATRDTQRNDAAADAREMVRNV